MCYLWVSSLISGLFLSVIKFYFISQRAHYYTRYHYFRASRQVATCCSQFLGSYPNCNREFRMTIDHYTDYYCIHVFSYMQSFLW